MQPEKASYSYGSYFDAIGNKWPWVQKVMILLYLLTAVVMF